MRFLALAVVAVGAVASIALMLRAGSRQQSLVLIALFVGWVLSPFLALGWAALRSNLWSARVQAGVHGVMVIVALWSVAMYDGVLPMPSGSRPAAVFLWVPFLSWVLFAILAGGLRLRSGRS